MCAQGWLVPKLSWTTIGWVVAYTVVWVFVMDIIKRVTYRVIDRTAGWQAKLGHIVTEPLKP